MTLYETTFIVDPQLQEEGWEKSITKYSEIITRNGAIQRSERWGLRRLAYPIKKRAQGYYVHLVHESAPSVPRELERQFLLDENCLRYLTVLADNPQYLDEMEKRKATREEGAPFTPEGYRDTRERSHDSGGDGDSGGGGRYSPARD